MLARAQALNEIPRERAEWILWLDMDLLINNMTFTLPLDKYEGKDLIMHGQADLILKGEARKGAPCWTALGIILAAPVLFRPSLACPPLHDPAGTTLEWLVCLSMHTGGSPCATDLNKGHF